MFRIKFVDNFLFKLLNFLVEFLGNYGLAIIATTIIIKLLLLPLSIKQEHAMRKQNEIQPKINALNKKYPKKGPEYNKELKELYETENVNPLLGCLPLLIQFPIFVGLYNLFNTTTFPISTHFLWFDLTKPDSLFLIAGFSVNLLPILSALAQMLQQKLMQPSMEEMDEKTKTMQKTMLVMPLMMLILFYRLSSALNLYFLVNTILSIIQSYVFIQLRKKKVNNG